jgi:hypothetical protein
VEDAASASERPPSATLRLSEAIEVLLSPYAFERFSPLTGAPVLVVDFGFDPEEPQPEQCLRLREALERLACPTLAICPEQTPATTALADRFDVVLPDLGEAPPLLETVADAPLASLALVQLLRQGEHLDLHHALVASTRPCSRGQSSASGSVAGRSLSPPWTSPARPFGSNAFTSSWFSA